MAVATGAHKQRSYNGDYMDLGREAERIVMAFLQQQSWVIGIDDYRDLKAVQGADIDCAVYTLDGRAPLVEIKGDSYLGVSEPLLPGRDPCAGDRNGAEGLWL
jgi:hypothetical protein